MAAELRLGHGALDQYLEADYLILVPNQRIRDALLASYGASRSNRCWYTPDINAVDIWIAHQWQRLGSRGKPPFASQRLLNSNEETLLWLGIIEASQREIPLLNINETAASAQRAYRLYRLWLDDGEQVDALPPASGIPEFNQFREWSQRFLELCHARHLVSLVDATRSLVRALESGLFEPPPRVILVNFYQPPPLYSALISQLGRSGESRIVRSVEVGQEFVPSGVFHSFDDFASECRACADWAAGIVHAHPDQQVGILFEGNSHKLKTLERIFLDVFSPFSFLAVSELSSPFNRVTDPIPLTDSGLIGEALLILNLGDETQDSADFCRLLQSPALLAWEEEREQRIQLELHLREKVSATCSLSQLLRIMSREHKPYFCPQLAGALLQLNSQNRGTRVPRDATYWSEFFRGQLETLGWPGPLAEQDAIQSRLVERWRQLLVEYSRMSVLLGPLDRQAARSRLLSLCQTAGQKSSFDAGCRVSLLSNSDAVGLEFDHLWFLDLSDQSQPPAPNPSPFLLHSAQKAARIPGSHSDIQLQNARREFAILCRSTSGEIHASYHRSDGDDQFRPSSLAASFKETEVADTRRLYLNRLALAGAGRRQLLTPPADDPVPLADTVNPGGGQAILSDQSSCPFRAFARHRLKARQPESFSNGLNARYRGTALHIALEKLFTDIRSLSQLQNLTGTARKDLINRCAQQALEFLASRFPELMTPRFSAIERNRIIALLDSFLEMEAQRPEFQVFATERSVTWQHQQLQIDLKIDRIDKLADGALALIDYKTGKSIPQLNGLLKPRPENLQLPVYHAAVSGATTEAVEAIVFAQLHVARTAYTGLAANSGFHPDVKSVSEEKEFQQDWSALTADWHLKLAKLADEFCEGVARVDPVNAAKTCAFCDLQPLCRIQELGPRDSRQESGDPEEPQ